MVIDQHPSAIRCGQAFADLRRGLPLDLDAVGAGESLPELHPYVVDVHVPIHALRQRVQPFVDAGVDQLDVGATAQQVDGLTRVHRAARDELAGPGLVARQVRRWQHLHAVFAIEVRTFGWHAT
jgi:hypothetical protein